MARKPYPRMTGANPPVRQPKPQADPDETMFWHNDQPYSEREWKALVERNRRYEEQCRQWVLTGPTRIL